MATAPVKSQPLHNFSLPLLKWGHKNQINTNHRYRRPSETLVRGSPPPPAEYHRSPPQSEQESSGGSKNETESENLKLAVGSRSAQRNRFSFASCSSQKPQQAVVFEGEGNEVCGDTEKEKVSDEADAEGSPTKPWNLRPRKACAKATTEIAGVSKNGELRETEQQIENLPKSMRLRGFAEGNGSENKEKRKFWIALSREEIEEDLYSMTGLKPARRPKKRNKSVQKQLDNIFPGLSFAGLTADDLSSS